MTSEPVDVYEDHDIAQTYDLPADIVEKIRAARIELPEPVCKSTERLVHSVQAFREHFEDWPSDHDRDAIADATDEQIANLLYGDRLYEAWHDVCLSVLQDLRWMDPS